jgi:lipopolysaccharide export system permease protein
MKIIDRYILFRFLTTFIFVVFTLTSVIIVIDLTDKMDKLSKADVTTIEIAQYYWDYVAWVTNMLAPITAFISTVFICGRMAGHSEIIAILSGGVSFRRMLFPLFLGATLIASTSFVLNGWVIPESTKRKIAFENQYTRGKYYFNERNIHIQVAPDEYLYLESYNNTNDIGMRFTIEKFEGNVLLEKLTANRIEWDSTKSKWTLRDWRYRKIDAIFEGEKVSKDFPQKDLDERSGVTLDTALVIHPKEFENNQKNYEGMTIPELNEFIVTMKKRGASGVEFYEVEKYTRFAAPFSIFILVFMGALVSSKKSREGTGFQIALGFLLSFIYILFFVIFRSFAEAGEMGPQISVWIPNIIFGIISIFMYKYVPR